MKAINPFNWYRLLESRLSNYPIKRKISAIFVLAGLGIAMITVVLFLAFEWTFTRKMQIDSVKSLAEVAAFNAGVPLHLDDVSDATDLLRVFDHKNGIVYSSVSSVDGNLFVEHGKKPKVSAYDLNPRGMSRISYLNASLEVLEPIFQPKDRELMDRNPEFAGTRAKPIGYVYIVSDLSGFYASLLLKAGAFLLMFFIAGFAVFLLAARFSGLITTPILALAKTAKLISREHDFGRRQSKLYADETGDLVDAFNEMIEQVQLREEIIRSNEDRFRAYFELGVVGMSILDSDGRFVDANNQLTEMFGSNRGRVHGSLFDDWVAGLEAEKGEAQIGFKDIQLRCDPSFNAEVWLRTGNGERIYTIVSARELRKADEDRPIYLVLFQDITDRKRSEEELLVSKQAAEEANRSKDEFLSVMSHELRTPLNPILGFVDLLLRIDQDEEHRKMLFSIRKSSEHLLTLITDVLEFTRGQAGGLAAAYSSFALDEMCDDVVEMMKRSGMLKGVDISIRNIDTSALSGRMGLVSDPGKVRQLAFNLLSNAVKYNQAGGSVWLDAVVDRKESGELQLIVTVEDTGVGIQESKLGYIFEPFTQLDMSLQRVHEGVGLGLSICKRIVECLGGELKVRSKVGEGSVFEFRIPVKESEVASIQEEVEKEQLFVKQSDKDCRILLVEDDAENKRLIETILNKMGIGFDWAGNGAEAMEKLQDSKFDLVLMDIRMPVMDGLEATRRIRSKEELGKRTPIVAMTAHATQQIQTECDSAGMDGYLSKPVNYQKLEDYIRRYI